MTTFNFRENQSFIINSVAKPYVIKADDVSVDLQPDFNLFIEFSSRTIKVKDTLVKSTIIPTLGITGLLLKKSIERLDVSLSDTVLDILTPLLKENISNFMFFLESDSPDTDAVLVYPLFDKHLDPIDVPEDLHSFQSIHYLPVHPEHDYLVYNYDQDTSDKNLKIDFIRPTDIEKSVYPIITNKTSILWKDKWDQRAIIFLKTFNLGLLLPRNYGKDDYKLVDDIFDHVDTLIEKLDINSDYDKEYNEMLSAKLPNKGIAFMMDTQFADHRLITILQKIVQMREELKPSLLNNISQCLGYMVAKKIHCCSQCRLMDTETL